MKTVQIIIVDDESGENDPSKRRKDYKALEKKFNQYGERTFNVEVKCYVTCVAATNAIRAARGLYVVGLDMMLHGWDEHQKQQLRECIGATKPPIFAISAHFSNPDATSVYLSWAESLGRTLQMLHFSTIISTEADETVRWGSILDQFNTLLTTEMRLAISPSVGDNDAIRIVHVTDLHFDQKSIAEDVEQIASSLATTRGGETLKADFLAITGDVVNKGGETVAAVSPFLGARDWVKRALSSGWMKEDVTANLPNSRVLLVPGNHDFRQTLAAGAFLSHHRDPDKEIESKNLSGFIFKDSCASSTTVDWKFGLGPFLRLHEELTGSRFPHGSLPGYRIEGRFAALGIIILELWLQRFDVGKLGSFVESDYVGEILGQALAKLHEVTQPGDCAVVLFHDLDIQNRLPDTIEDRVYKTLGSIQKDRRVLVLKGHFHQSAMFKHANNPSVLIVDSGNSGGKGRVVSPITLKREGGFVTGCVVNRIIHSDQAGWQFALDKSSVGGGKASWSEEGWTT